MKKWTSFFLPRKWRDVYDRVAARLGDSHAGLWGWICENVRPEEVQPVRISLRRQMEEEEERKKDWGWYSRRRLLQIAMDMDGMGAIHWQAAEKCAEGKSAYYRGLMIRGLEKLAQKDAEMGKYLRQVGLFGIAEETIEGGAG